MFYQNHFLAIETFDSHNKINFEVAKANYSICIGTYMTMFPIKFELKAGNWSTILFEHSKQKLTKITAL